MRERKIETKKKHIAKKPYQSLILWCNNRRLKPINKVMINKLTSECYSLQPRETTWISTWCNQYLLPKITLYLFSLSLDYVLSRLVGYQPYSGYIGIWGGFLPTFPQRATDNSKIKNHQMVSFGDNNWFPTPLCIYKRLNEKGIPKCTDEQSTCLWTCANLLTDYRKNVYERVRVVPTGITCPNILAD